MVLQHILNPVVEELDHAFGLEMHLRGQAMLALELGA